MAEAHDAELLHQFRERTGTRVEVCIDDVPDVVVDAVHDLLGSLGLIHPLPIGRFGQQLRLEPASLK